MVAKATNPLRIPRAINGDPWIINVFRVFIPIFSELVAPGALELQCFPISFLAVV
jgi:hypothetical protein